MPENNTSYQAASGGWSYVKAGEWRELGWRVLARLGYSPAPEPLTRPAGVAAGSAGCDHLVAVSHTLAREGASICLLDVLRGLASRGHRISLVAPRDGPLAAEARAAGIAVAFATPPQGGARGAASYETALSSFVSRLGGLTPTTLLANTLASFHAVEAARVLGIPSLLVVHEGEPPACFFRLYPRSVQSRALGALTYPSRIVFVSKASLDAWPASHVRKILIRNAPDPAAFITLTTRWTRDGARAALGIGQEKFVFLNVGSICVRKGQDDLARIAPAIPGARFFCVGPVAADGSMIAERLRRSANVTVAGATDDVAQYYAAADAFVLTSRVENYPRVVQEAQAFGLPLIVTPVNGVPEQAGEGEALIYQPRDAQALTAACRRVISDAALRSKLGEASRRRAATFDNYNLMVTAYERHLTQGSKFD